MVWYFCCRKMGANMEKMQKNADYYEKVQIVQRV